MTPLPPAPRLLERLEGLPRLTVLDAAGRPAPHLRERALRLAGEWRRAGLRAGERLAVQLPNGPGFVAALLGCLHAGLTFVPLPPALPAQQRERRLGAVRARALVGEAGLRLRPGAGPEEAAGGAHPTVILFTSGSEGDGRPVALGEAALLHVIERHQAALGAAPGARIPGYLPWSHAFGFTLELLMGLLHGARLHPVSATDFPRLLAAGGADLLFTVPRMLERLEPASLRALQGGIVGGAPVRGALRERLAGTRLRVGYGQTECGPGASLGEAGEWERDDFLGRPLGCELALQAGDAPGQAELRLRGPNLALGYVDGAQLAPVTEADGWRATGDLAAPADGGFVFQGRRDELFKLDNGRMVNPAPLELPYGGAILLVGAGRARVQPLARGALPARFELPVPHLPPRLMPEAFWEACTTPTGKVSRRRAQRLLEEP